MMSDTEARGDFIDQLTDDMQVIWLGQEFLQHVRFVLQRIPLNAMERLAGNSEKCMPGCNIAFFAPDKNVWAQVPPSNTERLYRISFA